MIKALVLADYVVDFYIRHNIKISNIKLQRILIYLYNYIKDNYGLTLFKEPIVKSKAFELIPEVYYQYCIYGALPILSSFDTGKNSDYLTDYKLMSILNSELKKLCKG